MDILNARAPVASPPPRGAHRAIKTVYDAADGTPLGRFRATAGDQVVITAAGGTRVLPLHLVTIRQELRG